MSLSPSSSFPSSSISVFLSFSLSLLFRLPSPPLPYSYSIFFFIFFYFSSRNQEIWKLTKHQKENQKKDKKTTEKYDQRKKKQNFRPFPAQPEDGGRGAQLSLALNLHSFRHLPATTSGLGALSASLPPPFANDVIIRPIWMVFGRELSS